MREVNDQNARLSFIVKFDTSILKNVTKKFIQLCQNTTSCSDLFMLR